LRSQLRTTSAPAAPPDAVVDQLGVESVVERQAGAIDRRQASLEGLEIRDLRSMRSRERSSSLSSYSWNPTLVARSGRSELDAK